MLEIFFHFWFVLRSSHSQIGVIGGCFLWPCRALPILAPSVEFFHRSLVSSTWVQRPTGVYFSHALLGFAGSRRWTDSMVGVSVTAESVGNSRSFVTGWSSGYRRRIYFLWVNGAWGLPSGDSLGWWSRQCLHSFCTEVEAGIRCLLRAATVRMFRMSSRLRDRHLLCALIDNRSNTLTVAGSASKPVVSHNIILSFWLRF